VPRRSPPPPVLVEAKGVVRKVASPHGPGARSHLLSNGRFSTVVTAAGSGYSRGTVWPSTAGARTPLATTSAPTCSSRTSRAEPGLRAIQPTLVEPDAYQASFSEDKVEISRRDGNISTTLTVLISEEDDAEVRRVSLTNTGSTETEMEVTSYAELVLAPPGADAAHPAFSNLFVQTEAVPGQDALLANRRPRSEGEERCGQGMCWRSPVSGGGASTRPTGPDSSGAGNPFTERRRWIAPLELGGAGARSRLQPQAQGAAAAGAHRPPRLHDSGGRARSEALDLVDKFSDPSAFERTATLAWTQAQVRLHHLRIEPEHAHTYPAIGRQPDLLDPGAGDETPRPRPR
jgi:cyclic beta-1,2-glucan synthetase